MIIISRESFDCACAATIIIFGVCFRLQKMPGKIWNRRIFTLPGNLGLWYLRWSRKSGPDVFLRSQEIWESGIYVGPENLDQLFFALAGNLGEWYLHWYRKSGPVVFFTFPGNLGVWYLRWSRKSGPVAFFTFPGNLGEWYLRWSRKSGPVLSSRSQEIYPSSAFFLLFFKIHSFR